MRGGRGTGGAGSAGAWVEVALEEDRSGAPDDGAGPVAGPTTRPRDGRRRLGILALVLALVGVAGLNGMLAWADHRERAALAEVEGLLSLLPEAPVIGWEADGRVEVVTGTGLVVLDQSGEGLSLLDVETGAPRWRAVPPEAGYGWWSCRSGDGLQHFWQQSRLASQGDVVLCAGDGWAADQATGDLRNRVFVDAVDLRTGQVSFVANPPGFVMDLLVLDGDVVVATWEDPGTLYASRHDLATGQAVWTLEHTVTPAADQDHSPWQRAGDGAVVAGTNGPLHLSLQDGTLEERPPDSATEPVVVVDLPLPGLTQVRTTTLTAGSRTELLGPGGDVARALADVFPPAPVLDPRTEVLVLGSWTGLEGVDATTGETAWRSGSGPEPDRSATEGSSTEASIAMPVLQVDGVAVMLDVPAYGGSRVAVRAVDERTGDLLWSHDSGPSWSSPVSDGRRVLFTTGAEAAHELVAVGLRDGTEHWRTPLPVGTQEVRSVAGHLVAQTFESVHVYGPRRDGDPR